MGSMREFNPKITIKMGILVVSISLVCIATMALTVYVPATRGYFNLGETMVYTVAILFGPYIGALAGGIGSALADLLLGYAHYAPATLVIKAVEGLVVGYLARRVLKASTTIWKYLATVMAIVSGFLLCLIGVHYYSGHVDLTLGVTENVSLVLPLYVPMWFWVTIGILFALMIILLSHTIDPRVGWTIVSLMAGGSLMVLGYFMYETLIFGMWAALVEVPVNIGQVTVGLAVAIPLTKALENRVKTLLMMK
ncbi:MAG: hypothetical protein DRN53_02115 [Thermoprotei archaeon]|nr:MAG: hypothetical protein DRN53_02115 [Thermoprotei archaeon]